MGRSDSTNASDYFLDTLLTQGYVDVFVTDFQCVG